MIQAEQGWKKQGEFAAAKYREAAELFIEANDLRHAGLALGRLGEFRRSIGQCRPAQEAYKMPLGLLERFPPHTDRVLSLVGLAACLIESGRVSEALGYYDNALRIARLFGDGQLVGSVVGQIVEVYKSAGETGVAASYLSKATFNLPQILKLGCSSSFRELCVSGLT